MNSNLPPGVTDAMIDAQCGDNHHPHCPANEDAEPRFTECGGIGVCCCYGGFLWGTRWLHRLLDRWRCGWVEICVVDEDPECLCGELDDNDAADRADAAEDARRCW